MNSTAQTEQEVSPTRQQLLIEGASCGSCVNRIESALKQLPGVDDATMNLVERTVTVTGSAVAEALIAVSVGSGR